MIEYGIIIEFNRQVPDVFNGDGTGFTNKWAISTGDYNPGWWWGDYTCLGITHKPGYLSKGKMGNFSSRVDISKGGTYSYDGTSFSFSIRNGGSSGDNFNIFSNDIINAYQINVKGAKVYLTAKFTGATYRRLWNGYVDSLAIDDSFVKFVCKTNNKISHTSLPTEEFNIQKFPFIKDGLLGTTMPEVLGWCPRAKLYPTQSKRELLRNIFTNADRRDLYNDLHREVPITTTPIKAISDNGTTVVVLRGRTGDALAEFSDKTGYNLDVIMGGGKGASIEIIKNYIIQSGTGVLARLIPTADGEMGYVSTNFGCEYEAFVLATPLDIDDVVVEDNNYLLTGEILERMKAGEGMAKDYFAAYGINIQKYLAVKEIDESKKIPGFDPSWNRAYLVPMLGEVINASSGLKKESARFKNNETLYEYTQSSSEAAADYDLTSNTLGNSVPTPPAGTTYIVLPTEISYVCVAKYKADLLVSTNSITNVAYEDTFFGNPELIYHDEDYGEMDMGGAEITRNTRRSDSDYPKITISKSSVENPELEMALEKYIAPSKVVLTDATTYDAMDGGAIIPSIGVDLPLTRGNTIDTPTQIISINGATEDRPGTCYDTDAVITVEFDAYFDDLDALSEFSKIDLGARLIISPRISSATLANDPTISNSIKSVRTQVFAVDSGGNVIKGGAEAMFYHAEAIKELGDPETPATTHNTLEQGSTAEIYTEDPDINGRYTLEGLNAKYFADGSGIVPDVSGSGSDITDLVTNTDIEMVIKCFRVRVDLILNSRFPGVGPYPNGNPWSVWLDTVGLTAIKEMDSSRIVANCQGLTSLDGSSYDINPTPPRVIKNLLNNVDGLAYDEASFTYAYEYFYKDVPSYFGATTQYFAIGCQLQKSTPMYSVYNAICGNSMLAMWKNRDDLLKCKYWLGDIGTTPTITHDSSKIIVGSTDIQPNISDSVYTEYEFNYAYDPVLVDYRKEFHIRYAGGDEFPSQFEKESSSVLLTSTGLPVYISAIGFAISYSVKDAANGGVGAIGAIELSTISGIDKDDLEDIGLAIGSNLVLEINGGVSLQVIIANVLKTSAGFSISCEQVLANSSTNAITSTNLEVRSTSTDYIWTRWCNATINNELSYAKSKEYWDKVHETYAYTGIVAKAPSTYTDLPWVHEEITFNTFLDRYLYWTSFQKYVPTYKLALGEQVLDDVELLNFVTWEDSVHTNYKKYALNDDGSASEGFITITERQGWITDYTISPSNDTVEVKLILDKERDEPMLIDENTNPAVEDTVDENTNRGSSNLNENAE